MKVRLNFIIIISFFQVLLFNEGYSQNLTIKNGYLDVTNIQWKDNVIALEGTVDFYWKEFLLPTAANDSLIGHVKYEAPIPKPWTKIEVSENNYCTQQGYATYRFQIKVDNCDEVYGLKINTIFTAYKLFVNGKLITSSGKVGKVKNESQPKFTTKEIPLPVYKIDSVESQILDIVLHVSNFHHRRGGLQRTIFFSTMDKIVNSAKNALLIHLLLIGIILIIGFNHVLMYLLRRLDIANILFGALATIMILRDVSTGERILLHLFPNMDWELLVRLDNFSGFGTMTFFALYFYFIFRKDFPKVMFYLLVGLGLLISILVFSTNQWFYGQFRILLEAYVGLGGLYLTFGVLLVATIKKREGAIYTFIGMFLLYTTAIHDVLNSMGIINNADIAPYGIAIFMLMQSFILTKKSAKALISNQKLSEELSQEKINLEKRIKDRTQKLANQANELESYKEEQERQNKINEGLNQITKVMRKNKDNLNKLADQLLSTLIKRIDASMGALYLHVKINDTDKLKLLAHYGLNKEAQIFELDTNEGLTGKCFSLGKASFIGEITDKYFSISSGLGSATPKNLALIPMKIDELIIGVIEIASFKPITKTHKAFLTRAIENIASQLNIVKMSDESHILIAESRKLEKEATAKNQEMMESVEELKAVQEESEKKEEEIRRLLDEAKKRETEIKNQLSESYERQTLSQERLEDAQEEIARLKKKK